MPNSVKNPAKSGQLCRMSIRYRFRFRPEFPCRRTVVRNVIYFCLLIYNAIMAILREVVHRDALTRENIEQIYTLSDIIVTDKVFRDQLFHGHNY